MTYYGDNDPGAAGWLRQLIADGLVSPGTVDERSIANVQADDVRGYKRAHFFAGIGGWELALRLAGWPDDRPVWTGSCPCQPYSAAGKGLGDNDPRNLWPHFFRLIRECRPATVFGEQVEGAIRHGWLDGICRDLEGEGYAVGFAVLGAHSVGAPHIRQRLYWVADADGGLSGYGQVQPGGEHGQQSPNGGTGGVEHPESHRREQRRSGANGRGTAGGRGVSPGHGVALGDAMPERLSGAKPQELPGARRRQEGRTAGESGRSFWSNAELIACRDRKARRVEPRIFPLADGVPGRVGLLRGSGNAIVPQVAAAFIKAFIEARGLISEG